MLCNSCKKESKVLSSSMKKDKVIDTVFIETILKNINNNDIVYSTDKKNNKKLMVSRSNSEKIDYYVKLPFADDYNGFALNQIKKQENGFMISFELGKYYIARNFYFENDETGDFLLKSIATHSFDYDNNNDEIYDSLLVKRKLNLREINFDSYMYGLDNKNAKEKSISREPFPNNKVQKLQ